MKRVKKKQYLPIKHGYVKMKKKIKWFHRIIIKNILFCLMPSLRIKIFNKVLIKMKRKKKEKKKKKTFFRSYKISTKRFFFFFIKVYKKYRKEIKEDNYFRQYLNYGNLYSISSVFSEEKNFLPDIL